MLPLIYIAIVVLVHSTISVRDATAVPSRGWITDGSPGFVIKGDVVTYVSDLKWDNVFNAMWQEGEGVSSGEHYWKIRFPILKGGAGVGLTSKKHFKKGYACEAIEYLGNLSNGGGLLVENFGPNPKQGDTIGILAAFKGDRLKVYIEVNGLSLGLAFDVPASTFKSIYPMVSFTNSGSATCVKQTAIPNITKRSPTKFTGIEGDWELTELRENGAVLALPLAPTAQIRKTGTDKYSLAVRVFNTMWTQLSKVGGNWRTYGCCPSTLMRLQPKELKLENAVKRLLTEVKMVEVNKNGNLSVKAAAMSSTWTRYDAKPFVGKPFA